MKRIFVIDWCLLLTFALTAYSGIKLHVVRHVSWQGGCRPWANFHTWVSLAFVVLMVMHIYTHWGWYKGWISKGLGKKSRVTVVLSLVFLMTSVTGIVLLAVQGCCSGIDMWHYKMGIALSIICVGHFIKRFPILKKSLGK